MELCDVLCCTLRRCICRALLGLGCLASLDGQEVDRHEVVEGLRLDGRDVDGFGDGVFYDQSALVDEGGVPDHVHRAGRCIARVTRRIRQAQSPNLEEPSGGRWRLRGTGAEAETQSTSEGGQPRR